MAKEKKWQVDCLMCGTTAQVEAEKIIGKDKKAEFLVRPIVICGKCKSVCTVELE